MKTPSTDLFDLVQSLRPSEQRYLKVRAFREGSRHLQLLEELQRMDVYDETGLKDQFKDLPVLKRYLYDWILEGLFQYTEKQIEEQVLAQLDAVRLLIRKALYGQAYKKLVRAKRKAEKYELFQVLVPILQLEKQLMGRAPATHRTVENLEALVKEEQACLEAIQHTSRYWLLYNRIYDLQVRYQRSREQMLLQQLEAWRQEPLLADLDQARTLRAKLYFLQAWATYYFTIGKPNQAYQFNRSYLELLEGQPHYLRLYPEQYLSTLQNYLIDSMQLRKEAELKEGLQRLIGLPDRKEFKSLRNLRARVFHQRYLLEINWSIERQAYTEGLALLPDLDAGLQRFGKRIPAQHRYTLLYLGGYLQALNGHFHEALEWVNQLLSIGKQEVVPDVFHSARLLNLIIHFRLRNQQLIESLTISTRRYLRTKRSLFQSERALFRFLQQWVNASNQKEQRQLEADLLQQLKGLQKDPDEARLFTYLDLVILLR